MATMILHRYRLKQKKTNLIRALILDKKWKDLVFLIEVECKTSNF